MPSSPDGAAIGPTTAERRRPRAWTWTWVALLAAATVLAAITGLLANKPWQPANRPGALPATPAPNPGPLVSPSASVSPSVSPTPHSFDELLATRVAIDPEAAGPGRLVPVPGSDPPADPRAASLYRYRVDVEHGLPIDPEFFAEAVHRTLNDPRGWGNDGERSFARVSGGSYDFVITLASPGTTAEWCAKSGLDTTVSNVSCDSAFTDRVVINAWRWGQGSGTYGDDIRGYRQMLINHEVGHRLGYGHADCTEQGTPAPVMMQQTKFLTSPLTGLTCHPNPWPHP